MRPTAPYLAALAGVLGLALSVMSVAAESRTTFRLRVYDAVSLPSSIAVELRQVADRALADSEIALEWHACRNAMPLPCPTSMTDIVVRIVHAHPGMAPNHCGFALGRDDGGGFISLAVGCAERALEKLTRRVIFPNARVSLGTMLGYTLAHELAHVLLPGQPHSDDGIFSGRLNSRHWTHAMEGKLAFQPADIQRLRAAAAEQGVREAAARAQGSSDQNFPLTFVNTFRPDLATRTPER